MTGIFRMPLHRTFATGHTRTYVAVLFNKRLRKLGLGLKMSQDQKNKSKSLAWFRSLPEDTEGISILFLFFFKILTFFSSSLESIVEAAVTAQENAEAVSATANSASTKDDIARLIHLYKEPLAQRHWTDLYSVLTRSELDARKSDGNYGVPANTLSSLVDIFNDYDNFVPQNLMLQYVTSQQGLRPVKKFPNEASSPEWSYLVTQCQEIEPTNLSHKNFIRGPDWIKTQWADIQKNLHQMFLQYNCSGKKKNNDYFKFTYIYQEPR
jgi:hypothetical protein